MAGKSAKPEKAIVLGMSAGTLSFLSGAILLGCLCVGMYSLVYYTTARRPAPKPYPGAEVSEPLIAIGGGRREYKFEYTVDLSLDDLQEYYEKQFEEYCVDDDWQFSPTENACVGYVECRVASCDIAYSQWFLIYLRSVSRTRTNVLYIHETAEP
jgi:hypothetical protein